MVTVGSVLKDLRESAIISQTKLGQMLDLSQTSIARYETGHAEAPYKVLLWYADYFDVSMDYIYGRTDQPQGKLYDYQPQSVRERLDRQEDWEQFVEACFDPRSPMYSRLKEMMIKMAGSESK